MVLQRGPKQAVIHGFSDPEDDVIVLFAGRRLTARARFDTGSWSVALPPQKASTTPRTITCTSRVAGITITLDDVLFGDVVS